MSVALNPFSFIISGIISFIFIGYFSQEFYLSILLGLSLSLANITMLQRRREGQYLPAFFYDTPVLFGFILFFVLIDVYYLYSAYIYITYIFLLFIKNNRIIKPSFSIYKGLESFLYPPQVLNLIATLGVWGGMHYVSLIPGLDPALSILAMQASQSIALLKSLEMTWFGFSRNRRFHDGTQGKADDGWVRYVLGMIVGLFVIFCYIIYANYQGGAYSYLLLLSLMISEIIIFSIQPKVSFLMAKRVYIHQFISLPLLVIPYIVGKITGIYSVNFLVLCYFFSSFSKLLYVRRC